MVIAGGVNLRKNRFKRSSDFGTLGLWHNTKEGQYRILAAISEIGNTRKSESCAVLVSGRQGINGSRCSRLHVDKSAIERDISQPRQFFLPLSFTLMAVQILAEVTTLARLYHKHVVRYYQAWIETEEAEVVVEPLTLSSDAFGTTSPRAQDEKDDESTSTMAANV